MQACRLKAGEKKASLVMSGLHFLNIEPLYLKGEARSASGWVRCLTMTGEGQPRSGNGMNVT